MNLVLLSKVIAVVKSATGVVLIGLGFILGNEILKNIGIIWSVLKCIESIWSEFAVIDMFQDDGIQSAYFEYKIKKFDKILSSEDEG